jgi:hypothetical protein
MIPNRFAEANWSLAIPQAARNPGPFWLPSFERFNRAGKPDHKAFRTSAIGVNGCNFFQSCYLDVPNSQLLRSEGAIGRLPNFIGHILS